MIRSTVAGRSPLRLTASYETSNNGAVFRPSCLVAIVLLFVGSAFGQAPPTPRPVTPGAATAPGSPAVTTPPPGAPDTVMLQYPNSDVADIIRLYETLTGKKLITDNFVTGKVNIFVARPIPRDEAIKIIEINLLMNGFSLVPAGGDLVKVIGTSGTTNPRNAGVPIISDEALIPAGEQVISFLFKLRFADATELQQVLGQYLSPPKSYTSFLALPKSSSILVTENSAVIRNIASIINQVDIPPAEVVSEFIRLDRADASKVLDMLREVFDRGTQPGTPGAPGVAPVVRNVRPGVPQPPPGAPPQPNGGPIEGDISALTALSEDNVVVGKIKMAADVRTNRIHVITRPVNMPFIRRLIGEFDANVEFAKPVTRALRYISAADVLPVIVQTLTEPGSNQGQGGAPGADPNAQAQQATNQQRRPSNSANTTSDFGQGGAGGGGLNVSEELSTQSVDTRPTAVTIGNAKIIADQRANTIIILGNREVVVKVTKLLDQMDVSAPQVALSTVIGSLTLRNDEEFGLDYFYRFANFGAVPGDAGIAAGSRNTGGAPVNPGSLTGFAQIANAAATGGASVFLSTGAGLSAIVRALDSTGRFKTISRPTVFTSNNKKAIIASGTEIPVPVSTISTNNGGGIIGGGLAQQSNIQFKKVALQLEVVPLINSEREVSLDILQKLDEVAGSTRIDNNDIPTISTRYIKTTVTAPNCSTLILGGLVTDRNTRAQAGIPVLSRIPVIGGIFRNTSKAKAREELVILMRPEVSLTKTDLQRLRQKAQEKTHFGPEIDQDDCPDCPPGVIMNDGKEVQLPAPDLPEFPTGGEE
jgi:general secretion pathway protein D